MLLMHKSLKALLACSIVLTVSIAVTGLRRKTSAIQSGDKQSAVDESQFPIAEESEPEPSDAEKPRNRRRFGCI